MNLLRPGALGALLGSLRRLAVFRDPDSAAPSANGSAMGDAAAEGGGDDKMMNMILQLFATIQTNLDDGATSSPFGRLLNLSVGQPPPVTQETDASVLLGNVSLAPSLELGNWTNGTGRDLGLEPLAGTLIILLGIFLSVLTAGMNVMVMISFKIDKQLQTISNYFLFSLAVADAMIGAISIPFLTVYIVQEEWRLGYLCCQFWLSTDYLMSNASVYNLLLISFDRYFSVTRPLTYRPRRTTRKALVMIASTYLISLILWPPWIISWPYIEGQFTVPDNECMVQFLLTNPVVTIGTILAAFYFPVAIIVYLYARVYYETQKRQKEFGHLQASNQRSVHRPANNRIPVPPNSYGCSTSNVADDSSTKKLSRQETSQSLASRLVASRNGVNGASGGFRHFLGLLGRKGREGLGVIRNRRTSVDEDDDDESSGEDTGARGESSEGLSRSGGGSSRRHKLNATREGVPMLALHNGSRSHGHNGGVLKRLEQQRQEAAARRAADAALHSPDIFANPRALQSRLIPDTAEPECTSPPLLNRDKLAATSPSELLSPLTDNSLLLSSDAPRPPRPPKSLSTELPTDASEYTVLIELDKAATLRRASLGCPLIALIEDQSIDGSLQNLSAEPGETTALMQPPSAQVIHTRSISEPVKEEEMRVSVRSPAAAPDSESTTPVLSRTSSVPTPHRLPPGAAPDAESTEEEEEEQRPPVLNQGLSGSEGGRFGRKRKKGKKGDKKADSKAAKTLSAILLVFVLTWTPYSIIVCIEAIAPGTVPAIWWTFSYYLCYINSTVNPLCYALCNPNFRRTYLRILKCQWGAKYAQPRPGAPRPGASASRTGVPISRRS